jgi:hypothetical protein
MLSELEHVRTAGKFVFAVNFNLFLRCSYLKGRRYEMNRVNSYLVKRVLGNLTTLTAVIRYMKTEPPRSESDIVVGITQSFNDSSKSGLLVYLLRFQETAYLTRMAVFLSSL